MTEKKKTPEPKKEAQPAPQKKRNIDKVETIKKAMSPALLEPIAGLTGLNVIETRNLLKDSVFKASHKEPAWTEIQVAAALVFAKQYDLNPITKEIQFFRNKEGKVSGYISYDGWVTIVNRQQDGSRNGVTFDVEIGENGKPISVQCNIYRKGDDYPYSVREFYLECKRETSPWRQYPTRMLRQRAFAQCARLAYGIGIPDKDEVITENTPLPNDVVDLSTVEIDAETGKVVE